MLMIGDYNVQVYDEVNVEQNTKIEYHLVDLAKFDGDDCVTQRFLYVNGDTNVIEDYFKEKGQNTIEAMIQNTKNYQKLKIMKFVSYDVVAG